MVAPSEGAEHVRDEVARAVSLLSLLTAHDPPENPLGALNPKALFRSKGLFFYHTCKVGLGIGFKWGSGILITHLQDEEGNISWSAPCLYKVKEASFGLLAGAGRVQTLLLLGTRRAIEQFKNGHATIGNDFKVMAGSDVGGVAEDAGSGDHHDAVCLSMADGAIVDFTINGGKISVDTAANEALYGPGITPEMILSTSASNTSVNLPGVSELYDALNSITADAKSDPRKFDGFENRWKPQSVLAPLAADYHKLKE